MAKYILYEETDEGKHIIGEYKSKSSLEIGVIEDFCCLFGLYEDKLWSSKLSVDEEEIYNQASDNAKYLLKNQSVVFCDNIYTYEKV